MNPQDPSPVAGAMSRLKAAIPLKTVADGGVTEGLMVAVLAEDVAALLSAYEARGRILRRAVGDLDIIGSGEVDKDHAAVYAGDMAAEIEEELDALGDTALERARSTLGGGE